MDTRNCPGLPRVRGLRDTSRRYLSFFLPLLAILLSAPLVEAQTTNPRASAAASVAARRLQVPEAELRVVNEVQLGELNSLKVVHLRTGRIEEVHLDAADREVPRERVEQVLGARRQAGFRGKLEKQLADKVAGSPATELTTVVVWVRLPGPPPRLERPGASGAGPTVSAEAYREFHRNATHGLVEQARARGWTVVYQAQDAPAVVLEVPNGEIQTLEARGDIDAIYLGRQYSPELDVSAAAIDVKGTGKVWSRGLTGTGVQIATVEGGTVYFGHSYLADGSYCNPVTAVADTDPNRHATGVAGVIASTHSTYRGIAYGAPALLNGNLANGTDAELMRCTEWAVGQGAKVINYSFGDVTIDPYFAPSDRYVDYIIRNRAVTIVKSAGNWSHCTTTQRYVTSPGKGYNVLAVGNYDDKNTVANSDDVMSGSSCYGNPYSVYGDRQKPEIAAPGVGIITTDCVNSSTCMKAAPGSSGTSFSAPHVTGCAALLMQYNSALRDWPEAIRAILMASAVTNIEGSTRLSDQDGAGGIECDSAHDILNATGGGEQHIPVTSANFPQDFTFSTAAGKTVRAVIAWDSTPDAPASSSTAPASDPLKADLDLEIIFNGAVVAGSYSRDNSYEIVEFTAPYTGTYTARIFATRFEGSSEYLGFAWWQGTRER